MNKFEDMSVQEVREVVTRTYETIFSGILFEAIRPNVPEMLSAISREWFKNLSTGKISPISNDTRNDIFICSKALNELHSAGVYYRID